MVTLGIDISIMTMAAALCVAACALACARIPVDEDTGMACVTASALSVTAMVIAYAVMAWVLDATLGLWW